MFSPVEPLPLRSINPVAVVIERELAAIAAGVERYGD